MGIRMADEPEVHWSNGELLIEWPHHEVLPPAIVTVAWGTAAFDPLNPSLPTQLVIDASTLPGGINESLGINLMAPGGHAVSTGAMREADWRALARRALVGWIGRWSPYADRAEHARQVDAAMTCQKSGLTLEAFQRFDGCSGYLLECLDWARDRVLPRAFSDELRAAAQSAVETLGPRHRDWAALKQATEEAEGPRGIPETVPDFAAFGRRRTAAVGLSGAAALAGLPILISPLAVNALAGSWGRSTAVWHAETFDWRVIPPVLSSEVGSDYVWRAYQGNHSLVLDFQLTSESAVGADTPLLARVGRARDGTIHTEAPFVRDGTQLHAKVVMHDAPHWARREKSLTVDIASYQARRPIASGRSKDRQLGSQEAIRGSCLTRLAVAASALNTELTEDLLRKARDRHLDARSLAPDLFDSTWLAASIARSDRPPLRGAARPLLAEYMSVARALDLNPP